MTSLTDHPANRRLPVHGRSSSRSPYQGFARGLARALAIAGLALAAPLTQGADAMAGMAMGNKAELGSSAAFAPDGQLVVVAKQGEHLVLYRSPDEGRTWTAPTLVNAQPEPISADGENRPKLAFTPDGGTLVAWTHPLAKPYTGQIRLARSDNGRDFAAPLTVHRDTAEITHRFESLVVAPDGRVIVAWIDKRDMEAAKAGKAAYRGAAIYSAVSTDGGRSFQAERKVADHSCECCRIATGVDRDGTPLLLWRHVFAPNERDHALTRLKADGTATEVRRATFDRWRVDACPHHGPSLAVDAAGSRHAVWFNQKDGAGHVFYGRLEERHGEPSVAGQRPIGGPQAAHADIAVAGSHLAIVWKEFDGERTRLDGLLSADGGQTFTPLSLASTAGASDQPHLVTRGDTLFAFWRTANEGFTVRTLP